MTPRTPTGRRISQLTLATRTGLSLGTVRRLLDPRSAGGCRLAHAVALCRALHVLGCPTNPADLLEPSPPPPPAG